MDMKNKYLKNVKAWETRLNVKVVTPEVLPEKIVFDTKGNALGYVLTNIYPWMNTLEALWIVNFVYNDGTMDPSLMRVASSIKLPELTEIANRCREANLAERIGRPLKQ